MAWPLFKTTKNFEFKSIPTALDSKLIWTFSTSGISTTNEANHFPEGFLRIETELKD